MFFLNPMDTISSLGKTAASSGFSKLKNHFNLTENVKEAVAQNPVCATFATAGITATLINPTTRVALCTLLRMSYSMSMITLNLVMIGLYLSWMGMKGAKGFMDAAKSTASQVSEQIPSNTAPQPKPSSDSTPAPAQPLKPENTPNPANWAQEYEQELLPRQNRPEQWASDYKKDFMDEALDELEIAEQPSYKQPQSEKLRAPQPNGSDWASELSDMPRVPQPNHHNWANELAANARKLPQFNVGEFLQFNNQIVGDEWAGEFVREQAQRGIPNIAKFAGGALAVGAGVIAAVKIYQALKEADSEVSQDKGTSYANTTSSQVQNGRGSADYIVMTENPLFL